MAEVNNSGGMLRDTGGVDFLDCSVTGLGYGIWRIDYSGIGDYVHFNWVSKRKCLNSSRRANIMGGWGGFLDKLLGKLPIQDRIERWKNEIDNLEREKRAIQLLNLDIDKAEDRKKADRLGVVIKRIAYLNQLCKNKTG